MITKMPPQERRDQCGIKFRIQLFSLFAWSTILLSHCLRINKKHSHPKITNHPRNSITLMNVNVNTLEGVFLTKQARGDIKRCMTRMTGKDYLDILNLVYLANRCEDIKSFIDVLFPSIVQVFHAECATFQLIKGYPCHINIAESRSFRADSHNLYEDNYYPVIYVKDFFYQHSPLLKEAISSSEPVLKFGDSISLRDWEKSHFYNNFMRPQHLYWELFLTLRWKNNLKGMITLWRSKEQKDYEDSDISKAEMLAPHLMVAINNIRLISRIDTLEKRLSSVNEANSEGLLWLDHKFTPSLFNAKARDICLRLFSEMPYDTFNLEKGEFPIPSYIIQDCSDLLDSHKAEEHAVLLPKERIISTESGNKFRVEYSLIWKVDQISSMPNFMVTLSDITDEKKPQTALQAGSHLSRRELDVICYLISGLSCDEIAEKLYISKLTVRTHIKNIYRKLGTKSKIELYRRVVGESCGGELYGNIQSPT
jgi:DNA-binding CsgD family transcriptional regulator